MNLSQIALSCAAVLMLPGAVPTASSFPSGMTSFLNSAQKGEKNFQADSQWFENNIPFLECSDSQIEEIYYYRWKLYKAHIRDLGHEGFVITEFLDDVGWQKHPYAMLNDATAFHIYEGRWLRDRQYMDGFINFLYPGGGNDRHFSESIADATFAYATAKGDLKWATQFLGEMRHIYNLWDDHFDFSKGLYFIEPLLDATEYTISSIDASGGKDGFRGGDSFRPTINAYMYANALAISRLSTVAGDSETASEFSGRADKLRSQILSSLWNEQLHHFVDRYQISNDHVRYWEFIRGRELAGYVPWVYGIPNHDPKYLTSWQYALSPKELGGPFGLRTVSPSYEYSMRQYRFLGSRPECQWNGPSWPFQTTQVLLGMANLLNDYRQDLVTPSHYLNLLKEYAQQHYLDGHPNLQEDYDPETGKPIVGLDRSHHYNHSGFNDLIITGLAGIRPRADNTLEVNPLIPVDGRLPYLCIENVPYHGHNVTVLWDSDGKRYGKGAGLSIYVDGRRRAGPKPLGRLTVPLGKPKSSPSSHRLNKAVNIFRHGFPAPLTSSDPDATIWQAIDGRSWFFPEMVRGWTPGAVADNAWYELDFGHPTPVNEVSLSFFADNHANFLPSSVVIEGWNGASWRELSTLSKDDRTLVANSGNTVRLVSSTTTRLRARFKADHPFRLVEFGVF